MRARFLKRIVVGALGAMLVAGAPALVQAQGTTGTTQTTPATKRAVKRAAVRARAAAMTPAERKVVRAQVRRQVRKQVRSMTPAARQWAKAAHAERKTTRASVRAGTMTRDAAAAARKQWRQANPRPRKSGR